MMAELVGSALLDASFSILKQNLLGKSTEDYLEELANKLAVIQTVLFDAGAKQFLDESVRQWADKVEDLCYEADGVLDEWRTAVLKSQLGLSSPEKVCFYVPFSCFLLPQFRRWLLRRDTRRKIIELNKNLDEIAMEKERFGFERKVFREERRITTSSTSLVDESKIYGRSDDKDRLISMLLSAGSKDKVGPEIIPIVGMGGIGKTTLAQLAYNDCKVKAHFDLRIWVHVGDAFDSISIAEQIMKAITGPISTLFELESLLSYISRSIEGKRFLLVLDDVWTEDLTKWESFEGSIRHGAVGSRVLVTTRKETVAHMMGATSSMIFLEKLSDDTCWLLFKNLAFSGGKEPVELEEIVKKILMKCNGIPLVAKALGSLMRSKYTREDWVAVSEHELWELGDVCSDIFAPLLLSYYDLPSLEKRCLLYCSLIPVECEIDKDDLIELWMSQGYLDANKNYEMGERCFESLAMRSFFQDFEMNFHGEIMTCKMHDIIHDLVQFLTRNSCICEVFGDDERTNQEYKTTRHYTLVLRSGAQIPISVYEKRKLRTLFVKRKEILTALNLNMLSELASLRTLCLSGCGIEKLPSGIDKLKHLRYLNLSDSPKLEELPYELCCLLNLQTLRLNGCTALRSLPKQMGKLMNLQHLYIEGCNQLQGLRKGIGRLSSLRRLDVFIVPRDYLQNNAEMNLGDFNNLKHLQGHLHICRIGNVEHAADAEEAHLRTKPNLADLQLSFSQRTGPRRTEDEWKVLLDVLQPHPDLKSLEIRKYNGATFSNWIVSMENLRRVVLNFCPNCVFLPPFGRLASLEILHIENMDKLVTVGPEFLGVKTGGDTSEIETWLVSFPKLKQLCFQYLNNWNQWLGIDDSMSSLKIMPSLRSLNIANCIKLRTLPDFIPTVPVQELTIDNCPSLDKEKNWSKISHIANIQKVGNDNELDSPGRPQHEKVFIDESEEKSSKGKGKEDIDGRRKSLNEVMEP